MNNVTIKEEKVDDVDMEAIRARLPDLNTLLEEVKREEEAEANAGRVPPVTEQFLEELYRQECEGSSDSVDDDDILKLQELLKEKQRVLKEAEALAEDKSPQRSNSRSSSRKRKNHKQSERDGRDSSERRRKRDCRDGRRSRSNSKTPPQTTVENNREQEQLTPEVPARRIPTLDEMEQLLKSEDFSSDEEPPSSNQLAISASMNTEHQTPAPPMGVPFNDASNQITRATPPTNYSLMYNVGLQQPFYPANMGAMPAAGYVFPHVSADQEELECLPVVNSAGFSGMPMFRRIKLERNPEASSSDAPTVQETAEDRLLNIFRRCKTLLEDLEIQEPTGKFTFTSTVAKLNPGDIASNSVLQKISNVNYEFHCIGPKLKLADWGLREIGSCNVDVAKKIAISADVYFMKIAEKAETMARKFIKVENAKTDATQQHVSMEEEEPTLSTFFKNSMMQTDPLICQDCAARNRIQGYDIAVQATIFSSSIGSQTSSSIDPYHNLAGSMNKAQLQALHAFSDLIRETDRGLPYDQFQHRINNLYRLIKQRPLELVPPPMPGPSHHTGMSIPNHFSSPMQGSRHPPLPPAHMNASDYHGYAMPDPRYNQPLMEFPGHSRTSMQDVRKSYGRGTYRQ